MLDMTMIRERRAEAQAEDLAVTRPLVHDINDLLHEVEKTPWRVRDLIGTGSLLTEWQTKTPWLRLCHLMAKVGQLSTAIVINDRLLTELTLGEIATICIDWIKEMEHARLGDQGAI